IPMVAERDAFWTTKQSRQAKHRLPYQPIHIPKNTPLALIISVFAFGFGFAVVWHIYWLAVLSFLAIVGCLVLRSLGEKNEYTLPAADVAKVEAAIRRRYA
ncbi:cytochrome o ubiquinol oxidase subunit I, partial [Candidatus Saccharibacteria bacterium]|nr:cytochrome o ubiquinol oxidase subunit I [Candidatus Saccharibacteria bacterium]